VSKDISGTINSTLGAGFYLFLKIRLLATKKDKEIYYVTAVVQTK